MHDNSHLDSFVDQQSDQICLKLAQRFVFLCRDPNVSSAEYSTRMRETLEELLRDGDALTDSLSA